MKTNSLFKRLVSMLIVVLMICTLFPVTALAEDGVPNKPTDTRVKWLLSVNIHCNTVNHDHTYYLFDRTFTTSDVTQNGDGEYICTVTVNSGVYISRYSDPIFGTGIHHNLATNEDPSKTVTLVYKYVDVPILGKQGQWCLESGDDHEVIEFKVVCEDTIAAPNFDDFKRLLKVEIECETNEDEHDDITYSGDNLIADSFSVGEVEGNSCTVTVSSEKYIDAFSATYNIEHSPEVDDDENNEEATVRLVYADGAWKLDKKYKVDQYGRYKIEFDVVCGGTSTPEPAVTGIEKEVMTSAPTDLTNVPTGITYPDANNIATVPYGTTSVTLLYKVTVSGDVGASYSVTDTDATCISNNASGTIPTGGKAFLYFTKTFTGLTTGDNTCSNTAAVGNTNSNTVDVTVKVSAPEKPTEKYLEEELLANGAVKIDCVNGDVEHADKTYGLLKGFYQIGEVTAVATGGYTCEVTVEPALYVAAYNKDIGVDHKLDPATQSAQKITLTYVATSGKWQVTQGSAPVTFYVKCVTPDPAPAKPVATDIPQAVKIDCVNGDVEHADATYGLIANSFTIGEVTAVATGGYTCEVTVEPALYVAAYNKDIGVDHKLDPATQSAQKITLTYVATSGKWQVNQGSAPVTFTVKCVTPDPAPKQPVATDLPEILWKEAVKIHCSVKTSHADATYGLLEDSYQIGEVTGNATKGYECTVTVNSAKYIEEYNKTNAGHKAVATDLPSRTITLKYTGSAWTVKSGSAPVVFYVECETSAPAPKQPVATDLPEILWKEAVKIHCSVKTSHADATYGLLEGSYQIGEVTGNATEGYKCTVTVNSAKYIEEYNKTNAGHKAVATDPSSRTITLKYTGSAWIVKSGSAPVVFYVECESPAPTTYTVTYKDGVGGKVFKDDVHTVESGATTPAFVGGIPTRPGYVFVGWTPAVSRCVTGNATYTATWRKVKDTTVIEIGGGNSSSSSKEENPNTGAPVFVGVSVGALAAAK